MKNTALENVLSASEIVGRQHGTAFFYNQECFYNFLDQIESRYKNCCMDEYYTGFYNGFSGKYRRTYRYLKE